jgi:hemoglobin
MARTAPGRPPTPSSDLSDASEVAEMVRRFYVEVAQDDLLGPVFNDVARVDWAEHLPKLTAFWCRMLLGIEGYRGNALQAHRRIHARSPFTTEQFDRWLEVFHETIDLGWRGPIADHAKALAVNIARVHHAQLVGRDPSCRSTSVSVGTAPPA